MTCWWNKSRPYFPEKLEFKNWKISKLVALWGMSVLSRFPWVEKVINSFVLNTVLQTETGEMAIRWNESILLFWRQVRLRIKKTSKKLALVGKNGRRRFGFNEKKTFAVKKNAFQKVKQCQNLRAVKNQARLIGEKQVWNRKTSELKALTELFGWKITAMQSPELQFWCGFLYLTTRS